MRCFNLVPISPHEGSWLISFLAFLEDEGETCSLGPTGVVALVVGPEAGICDRLLPKVPYFPLTGLRPVDAWIGSGANRKVVSLVGTGVWISSADSWTGV